MADVLAGYAFAFGPMAHVEFTPYLGLGREDVHLDLHATGGTVQPKGRTWGTASEYGVRGAAYRTFANRFQLGFEVLYGREESSDRIRTTVGGTDSAFEIHSHTDILEFMLGIGRRF